VVLGLGGVLIVVVGWVAWHVWQLNGQLGSAVQDASDLQQALRVGDPAAALGASESLQDHAESASDLTSGTTWTVIGKLPVVGDDAKGLALVSDVLAELSVDGVAPLAEEASDLNSMVPVDGRVSIERLEALQAPVATAHHSFDTADDRLSARDASGFVGPLGDKYADLAGRVAQAARLLGTADRALRVLPTMLGSDGPKSYLLVFQNNAEVRATGGLPGAISVITADNGRLTMGEQTTAVKLGEADAPVLPLTPAEQEIYGPQLGTYFLDANFTPSFPRAADLMAARWAQRKGQQVDGVLAVDTVAVSYVLGATGPVTVGPAQLSSSNAVDNLLHQIYVVIDDTDEQDELFKETARTVFDQLVAGKANPQSMLSALGRGASEDRLLVHSFDPAVQAVLEGSDVAGELTDAGATGPQVGMYLNDNTGAKMSYYLRTVVRGESTSCSDEGVQTIEGMTRMTSDAPEDAATSLPVYVTGGGRYGIDPGDQLVGLRIYGPVGGTIDEISLDGEIQKKPLIIDDEGRPVTTVYPYLEPKQSIEIGWTVTSGAGQDGDVALSVTPGIEPVDASTSFDTAC
jgi:hypothetical protein